MWASRREISSLTLVLALLAAFIFAPPGHGTEPVKGESRIITAPGLIANFSTQNATIGTQRPAQTTSNRQPRSSNQARATLTFPVARITNTDQIVLAGAMTVRTKDQQITLRNITVDLKKRVVFVSVQEFFGLTIDAFTITNEPTIRTSGATTRISNARLVVSQSAGQRLSELVGDPAFGAGALLGTASLQYTSVRS